jgi:hypothetical protein
MIYYLGSITNNFASTSSRFYVPAPVAIVKKCTCTILQPLLLLDNNTTTDNNNQQQQEMVFGIHHRRSQSATDAARNQQQQQQHNNHTLSHEMSYNNNNTILSDSGTSSSTDDYDGLFLFIFNVSILFVLFYTGCISPPPPGTEKIPARVPNFFAQPTKPALRVAGVKPKWKQVRVGWVFVFICINKHTTFYN